MPTPLTAIDVACLANDPVAEAFQHVGDHHPDHDLVLDDKHRQGRAWMELTDLERKKEEGPRWVPNADIPFNSSQEECRISH